MYSLAAGLIGPCCYTKGGGRSDHCLEANILPQNSPIEAHDLFWGSQIGSDDILFPTQRIFCAFTESCKRHNCRPDSWICETQ